MLFCHVRLLRTWQVLFCFIFLLMVVIVVPVVVAELQKFISSTVPGGDAKRPTPSYRSIISDVFDGRILSSVQCFTCETVSSTKEVFQDLSLPIPSRDHLNRLHHGPSYADLASSSTSLNSLASSQQSQQQGWMDWILGWVRPRLQRFIQDRSRHDLSPNSRRDAHCSWNPFSFTHGSGVRRCR